MNELVEHFNDLLDKTLVPTIKRAINNDYNKTHDPYARAMRMFNLNRAVQHAKQS